MDQKCVHRLYSVRRLSTMALATVLFLKTFLSSGFWLMMVHSVNGPTCLYQSIYYNAKRDDWLTSLYKVISISDCSRMLKFDIIFSVCVSVYRIVLKNHYELWKLLNAFLSKSWHTKVLPLIQVFKHLSVLYLHKMYTRDAVFMFSPVYIRISGI